MCRGFCYQIVLCLIIYSLLDLHQLQLYPTENSMLRCLLGHSAYRKEDEGVTLIHTNGIHISRSNLNVQSA